MKIFLFVLMIGFFYFTPTAEAVNPNINTQSSDLRSNGTNGNPGFNPCLGGTRSAAGVCSATAATTLLSTANLGSGGTLGLFGKLGPGAVTDNMFGIIEQPSDPDACAVSVQLVGTNRLNCGQSTWLPFFQEITLPATPDGTNSLTTAFTSITTLQADFCANGASDCLVASVQNELAHAAFDFNTTMTWTPIDNVQTTIVGTQSIIQVIGLKDPIGSLASPGAGEERVEIVTSWTGISRATTISPFGLRPLPIVDFTQTFSAPDMAGTGNGFTNISSGTIGPTGGTFGTEWVSGESQSNGDASGTQSFF